MGQSESLLTSCHVSCCHEQVCLDHQPPVCFLCLRRAHQLQHHEGGSCKTLAMCLKEQMWKALELKYLLEFSAVTKDVCRHRFSEMPCLPLCSGERQLLCRDLDGDIGKNPYFVAVGRLSGSHKEYVSPETNHPVQVVEVVTLVFKAAIPIGDQ